MSSRFDKKPILVRRGDDLRIVKHADQDKYRSLPGARWEKRKAVVHFCAGKFFTVDADETCRACRVRGACRPIKVEVLDITQAALPKISAARIPRPDEAAERRELQQIVARLPVELGRELRTYWKHFAPDEIEELSRITRDVPAEARAAPVQAFNVAWQWGASDEPEPVTSMTFNLDAPSGEKIALTQWRLAPTVAKQLGRLLAKVKQRHL